MTITIELFADTNDEEEAHETYCDHLERIGAAIDEGFKSGFEEGDFIYTVVNKDLKTF